MDNKYYQNNDSNYNTEGFYERPEWIGTPKREMNTKPAQGLRHRQIHSVVVWTPTSITPEEFEAMPLREKIRELRLQRQHANEQFIRARGKSSREGNGSLTEAMRLWTSRMVELDNRIANLTGQIAAGAARNA